jgi:hypothetical protein
MVKTNTPVMIGLFSQILLFTAIIMGKTGSDGCWKKFSSSLELEITVSWLVPCGIGDAELMVIWKFHITEDVERHN